MFFSVNLFLNEGNYLPKPAYLPFNQLILESLHTIINGCVQNNSRDQKCLYEKYYGYCLKVVFRYIYRYDKAVDVVNDGFVKIFRSFSKFEYKNIESLEMMLMGWMRKIAINVSIDYMRRESLIAERISLEKNTWLEPGTSDASDNQLMYKELVSLIRKLSPAYRVVFNLHVIDGYSHQEIARMLGISPGTSKSNLSKAKAFLQKFLVKDQKGNILCFT